MKIKTPSYVCFEGLSYDNGLVFYEEESYLRFKVMRYKAEEESLEIHVDCDYQMEDVATMVAGFFKSDSNFYGFKSITINYRGTKVLVKSYHSRKDIIQKYLKIFSSEEYKKSNNKVFVDTFSRKSNDDYFYDQFSRIATFGSLMIFSIVTDRRKAFYVKSYENANIEIDMMLGTSIDDAEFVVQNMFSNCSMFKGIKTVSFKFNEIGYICNELNASNIVKNYERGTSFSSALYQREQEEYRKSPEYIAKRAKELKISCREERVIDKVKDLYHSHKLEFSITKDKVKDWKKCKEINLTDDYSKCIIDYAVLMTQFMEFLHKYHNRSVEQSFDIASHYSDKIYGVTGYMHGAAVNIISNIWKYGEEVRKYHNKTFGYDGDGVVNPAILTIAA